jgi:hypothetical protein
MNKVRMKEHREERKKFGNKKDERDKNKSTVNFWSEFNNFLHKTPPH